jgi:hypothetical protein
VFYITKKTCRPASLLAVCLSFFVATATRVTLGQGPGLGPPREFTSEEGGFKVNFPDAPQKTVSVIGWEGYKIPITKYEAANGAWLYTITYFDFPYATDATRSKSLYVSGRRQILARPGRKLIEERDFYLDKRLGLELVIEDADSTSIQRLVLVGRRYYQLSVFMPSRFSDSSPAVRESFLNGANKFLDSFVLTNVSPSAKPKTEI